MLICARSLTPGSVHVTDCTVRPGGCGEVGNRRDTGICGNCYRPGGDCLVPEGIDGRCGDGVLRPGGEAGQECRLGSRLHHQGLGCSPVGRRPGNAHMRKIIDNWVCPCYGYAGGPGGCIEVGNRECRGICRCRNRGAGI